MLFTCYVFAILILSYKNGKFYKVNIYQMKGWFSYVKYFKDLKPRRPMSLMLPPKLISLERAQELSKSGKLSGSLNSSELLNQSEAVTSPPKVNPPVKYRDHDKSKPHERRLEFFVCK